MSQGEWRSTTGIIEAAVEILGDENPMTIRQLFYRLVSVHVIENQVRDYHQIIRLMTKARKDGRVDYDWIVDRSRATYKSHIWGSMSELASAFESELLRYRSDWWATQPKYVEIWCEKDTVTGSIEPVRDEYGVRVDANRGFNSTSNMHAAAQRLMMEQARGKDVHILYLGDWDPSGEDMERDLRDRLKEESDGALWGNLIRVAIKKSDIDLYDLPPLLVKDSDSRTKGFVLKHGEDCVELDALPPNVLRDRLRTWMDLLIDKEAWQRARLVEEAQRETNRTVAATIKQMMVTA
jgi:hypothetical protein